MNEIIEYKIGRTPLIRAKNLEKYLGVSKIYLKMEGTNPSGHIEDRLAKVIIKDALSRGKDTICFATKGVMSYSFAQLSKYFDINQVFYVSSKKRMLKQNQFRSPKIKIVETNKRFYECVKLSRKASRENGWYNGNPGLANTMLNSCAFAEVSKEIVEQLKGASLDTVFCETWNGTLISGIHLGFKQMLINDTIDVLPKINAVTTAYENAILDSYKAKSDQLIQLKEDVSVKHREKYLFSLNAANGQEALNAIYDTYGKVIGLSYDEIKAYVKKIRKIEKLKFSLSEAYPLVAFIKEAEKGNIKEGIHVIIMNDARTDIDISVSTEWEWPVSADYITENLKNWLAEYGDPIEEIREAVYRSFEKGFIICAFIHGEMVGITVIIDLGFEHFACRYHLAYIAAKKTSKGRGIATEMLKKAEELTEGNVSLHVEFDNKKAIKVYEKMGFNRSYMRMLHKMSS